MTHRTEAEMTRLMRQMHSTDNALAVGAVEELRVQGWLTDGSLRKIYLRLAHLDGARLNGADLREVWLGGASLRKADLRGANLQGTSFMAADLQSANLRGANLQRALLSGANLKEAVVADRQLAQAHKLRGATMCDGSRYDGRFDLDGDVEAAVSMNLDADDFSAMADYYGVSPGEYQRGQEWAVKNLPKVQAYPGEE
jgi:hypothetical protein